MAAPFIEELSAPGGRVVVPELLKGFLEQESAGGLEVLAEQIAQPEARLVFRFSSRFSSSQRDFFSTGARYGSHISEQTKTIFEAISSPMTVKNPWKGFDGSLGSFLADPEQARDVQIDLVNQRQLFVAFGVLDFVDPDGVDLAEQPLLRAECDNMLGGVEDLVPGSAKRLGCFLPGQPSRPTGWEQQIRFGQTAFAMSPRNLFHDDRPAAAAIDAPHGVQQKNQKAPERNELEVTLGELIVAGSGLVAARTDPPGILARPHGDFNALVIGAEASLLINESPKR